MEDLSVGRKAAERHVPFCEKWTKDHGRPQSPTFMYNTKSKADRAREVSIVKSVSIKLSSWCTFVIVNLLISLVHTRDTVVLYMPTLIFGMILNKVM